MKIGKIMTIGLLISVCCEGNENEDVCKSTQDVENVVVRILSPIFQYLDEFFSKNPLIFLISILLVLFSGVSFIYIVENRYQRYMDRIRRKRERLNNELRLDKEIKEKELIQKDILMDGRLNELRQEKEEKENVLMKMNEEKDTRIGRISGKNERLSEVIEQKDEQLKQKDQQLKETHERIEKALTDRFRELSEINIEKSKLMEEVERLKRDDEVLIKIFGIFVGKEEYRNELEEKKIGMKELECKNLYLQKRIDEEKLEREFVETQIEIATERKGKLGEIEIYKEWFGNIESMNKRNEEMEKALKQLKISKEEVVISSKRFQDLERELRVCLICLEERKKLVSLSPLSQKICDILKGKFLRMEKKEEDEVEEGRKGGEEENEVEEEGGNEVKEEEGKEKIGIVEGKEEREPEDEVEEEGEEVEEEGGGDAWAMKKEKNQKGKEKKEGEKFYEKEELYKKMEKHSEQMKKEELQFYIKKMEKHSEQLKKENENIEKELTLVKMEQKRRVSNLRTPLPTEEDDRPIKLIRNGKIERTTLEEFIRERNNMHTTRLNLVNFTFDLVDEYVLLGEGSFGRTYRFQYRDVEYVVKIPVVYDPDSDIEMSRRMANIAPDRLKLPFNLNLVYIINTRFFLKDHSSRLRDGNGKVQDIRAGNIIDKRKAFLMKYYGTDLLKYLKKKERNREVVLTVGEVLWILHGLILGVYYMFDNRLVHRDLHFENIFVDEENERVRIGDFDCSWDGRDNDEEWYKTVLYFHFNPNNPETGGYCLFTPSFNSSVGGNLSFLPPELAKFQRAEGWKYDEFWENPKRMENKPETGVLVEFIDEKDSVEKTIKTDIDVLERYLRTDLKRKKEREETQIKICELRNLMCPVAEISYRTCDSYAIGILGLKLLGEIELFKDESGESVSSKIVVEGDECFEESYKHLLVMCRNLSSKEEGVEKRPGIYYAKDEITRIIRSLSNSPELVEVDIKD